MPSPFPGMDPYLEAPSEFPSFHLLLTSGALAALQPQLRSLGYVAKGGERVWLAKPRRGLIPDVAVIERAAASRPQSTTAAIATDTPLRLQRDVVEMREPFVEIQHVASRQVVTAIKFISPGNKLSRAGRLQYRRKQRDCLEHGIHLVEVDLIRRGRPIVDVPGESVTLHGRWDYLVNVIRVDDTGYECYPIRLPQRLPRIAVPLRAGDPDVALDLQEVCSGAYETGAFADLIDYTLPPIPALAEDDAHWADELLKSKGLR